MTTKFVSTLMGLILLLAAGTAQARSTLSNLIKVNVPFEFVVGDKTLLAGNYTVEIDSERGTIVLRGDDSQPLMTLSNVRESTAAPRQSQLVFHRYGDTFFLDEVWTKGDSTARELVRGDREKELANKKTTNQTVIVQARATK